MTGTREKRDVMTWHALIDWTGVYFCDIWTVNHHYIYSVCNKQKNVSKIDMSRRVQKKGRMLLLLVSIGYDNARVIDTHTHTRKAKILMKKNKNKIKINNGKTKQKR